MIPKVIGVRCLVSALVLAGITACSVLGEDTGDQSSALAPPDMAKAVFLRLTGTGLLDNDPRFTNMVNAISDGRPQDAARIATADPNFYGVVLRNWSAPWSSVDGAIDNELDDLQALAIGLVKDDLDARLLLTGKIHYEATTTGIPAYSEANNDHFKALEDKVVDLGSALQKRDTPAITSPEYAGALTTRGYAKAYYAAGTNRRAVVFAIKNFLCTPQSSWRDPNLPENFVRRDVHRDPPSNYEAECRTCHAPMDAMSGAFAHFDFVDGKGTYFGPFGVAPKYNINTSVYPDGYQPTDDSWMNYATQHQNVGFGWHGDLRGKGIEAYGEMLANSDAFAKCMVKTAFQATCRRAPEAADQSFVDQASTDFVGSGYRLRTLFERIAISNQCP
jgi:hypothetical protein